MPSSFSIVASISSTSASRSADPTPATAAPASAQSAGADTVLVAPLAPKLRPYRTAFPAGAAAIWPIGTHHAGPYSPGHVSELPLSDSARPRPPTYIPSRRCPSLAHLRRNSVTSKMGVRISPNPYRAKIARPWPLHDSKVRSPGRRSGPAYCLDICHYLPV